MKFTEFISIIVIILAIVLTFKNSCGFGKIFETFTTNAPMKSSEFIINLVLGEIYPDLFPKVEDPVSSVDNVSTVTSSGVNTGGETHSSNGSGSTADAVVGNAADAGADTVSGAMKEDFSIMESFVGENCSEPSTKLWKGIDNRYEPKSWSSGTCSNDVKNIDVCGNYTDRLCGGKNRNDKGFDTSCPKKYIVNILGQKKLHPVYDINVCEKITRNSDTCRKVGERALIEVAKKYNQNEKLYVTESEAKIIGEQILRCYIAIRENRKRNASSGNDITDYTDVFVNQIKLDTKNRIENLINLRKMYQINKGSEGGKSQPRNGTGSRWSSYNDDDMPELNEGELRHYIARKRKIKGVCNYIRNSSIMESNGPKLNTNKRTTNQFGDICVKSGYDGYPEYTGFNNGGSYENASNINLGGINADKNGKYPTVLSSDPKPYNGIMSLF